MSLDNLPVEWSVSQLTKMIASEGLILDGDWIESKDQDEKGDIRLIQLADIGDGDFRDKSNRYMNQDAFDRLNCVELKANDVLIARMPDPLGRACIFPKLPYKCVTVVDVCLIRTGEHSAISPKLLKYWINATQIRNLIALNATGTTRKRITRKKLESFDFPVPPLAEQQEIVRQLDTMLAQVEQIKARLDAIPAILKKFRQSVLADAVSGRLLDDAVNSSIYTIKDIFEVTSGIAFKKSEYAEDGYKLLQIANVSHGKTKWETLNFISEQNAKQFDNCILQNGDVVVALNRPITHDLLKIAKITEQDLPAILYQRVACLRVKENKVADSEFLFLSMQTTAFRKAIEAKLRGSDQPYLNTSDLGNLTINLIPLNEQKLTLKKIRILLSKSNQMEIIVQSAQKRVNLLTQSILAKAFSGELTAEWREQHQDLITGVNSAEALLAKIHAEREASKPVKKTRKKKEA